MKKITQESILAIEEAVRSAEKKTSGEFVTVISKKSDTYYFIPTLWASLIALFSPTFIEPVLPFELLGWLNYIQVGEFVILTLLFQIPSLKTYLIPEYIKQQRSKQAALEQFLLQKLHTTDDRSGVLLFVSCFEHYVEIIADKGINDRVDQERWDQIVRCFISDVKNNDITGGFTRAIERCGSLLSEHFPVDKNNKNELPDRLVLL